MTVDSTSFFGSSATLQSKPMMPTAPECEVRFSYYHNKTVGGTTSITVKTIEDWGINTTNVVYSDIYQKFVDSVDEWKSMTVGVGSRPSGALLVNIDSRSFELRFLPQILKSVRQSFDKNKNGRKAV